MSLQLLIPLCFFGLIVYAFFGMVFYHFMYSDSKVRETDDMPSPIFFILWPGLLAMLLIIASFLGIWSAGKFIGKRMPIVFAWPNNLAKSIGGNMGTRLWSKE